MSQAILIITAFFFLLMHTQPAMAQGIVVQTPQGMMILNTNMDGVITASPLPEGAIPSLVQSQPSPQPNPAPQQEAVGATVPVEAAAPPANPVVCDCNCPNTGPIEPPAALQPAAPPTAGYDGEG